VRLARIFPRRTRATPTDCDAFTGPPPFWAKYDEVHVSVTFGWDRPKAEWLALQWSNVATVKFGGPAYGTRGEEFVPGRYIRQGYTITSRGCPNHCWFCSVWKRDGDIRELAIHDGWNVLDDNLLACSDAHVKAVFDMLKRQHESIEFTGGLEAARLQDWHIDSLAALKPKQMFFSYDTPDDLDPLVFAADRLHKAGFTAVSKRLRCYVLIGYQGDTLSNAEDRLRTVLGLGMWPMAMLYRDEAGKRDITWQRFQKVWARPASIYAMKKESRP
jgi:hypothetical protein